MTAPALTQLPAAPVLPPPVIGSVYSSDVIDAATGFLSADTCLRGGLRVFPLYTAQPVPGWRSTATSSLSVAASWRHRRPDAVAVRLGGRGRLGVLEVEDADALAAFGPLPTETVQSRSMRGCHRFWMSLDRDDLSTIHDLMPGVTLYASGSWMRLPPAGTWVAGLQPGRADFEPCQPWLLPQVPRVEPTSNVRRF